MRKIFFADSSGRPEREDSSTPSPCPPILAQPRSEIREAAPAFRFAPCGLQGLFGRAGEEKQISVGILDDEGAGAPWLLTQRLEEGDAVGLELEEELLDRLRGGEAEVGREQALAVAQRRIDHRPVHVAEIDQP